MGRVSPKILLFGNVWEFPRIKSTGRTYLTSQTSLQAQADFLKFPIGYWQTTTWCLQWLWAFPIVQFVVAALFMNLSCPEGIGKLGKVQWQRIGVGPLNSYNLS